MAASTKVSSAEWAGTTTNYQNMTILPETMLNNDWCLAGTQLVVTPRTPNKLHQLAGGLPQQISAAGELARRKHLAITFLHWEEEEEEATSRQTKWPQKLMLVVTSSTWYRYQVL